MIKSVLTSNIIELCVRKCIIPKVDSFAKSCKDLYNDYMIPKREHFEEYLYRSYKKYSILNTLVLKNQQKNLKDLYIPLTIQKCGNSNRIAERIDKYPVELVKEYSKILITDTAGMGKSTLTKFLFIDVIENGHGIPIYIELRRLSKERTILREIKEQLSSLSKDFDSELLLRFIQTGDFVFFLDGYDEIPFSEIKYVTSDIQEFISKANKNIFFMTSRPESSLSCFGDFQEFSIHELDAHEAYNLLKKIDNNGDVSKKLISELKLEKNESINDFLRNPLLVSLLFNAYDYKQVIPRKKHLFYRQVYEAYFDNHDLSKGDFFIHDKYSKLNIDDFNKILRYIAYRCLQLQKIEFEKDNLLGIIYEAKKQYPELHFSPSDFIKDIIITVPLFCVDGYHYRWVHKSLQEYFAVLFIYNDSEQKDLILKTLYNSINLESYINILDLYSDIDYSGFRKNIVLAFCKDYVVFYKKHYFKSDILKKEDIEYRISCLFIYNCYILVDKYNKFNYQKTEMLMKQYIDFITNIRLHREPRIFIALGITAKYSIYNLFLKKKLNLFKEYYCNEIETFTDIPCNDIFKLENITGGQSKFNYTFYNQYLCDFEVIPPVYLSYESCLNEINSISNLVKYKENNIALIHGL